VSFTSFRSAGPALSLAAIGLQVRPGGLVPVKHQCQGKASSLMPHARAFVDRGVDAELAVNAVAMQGGARGAVVRSEPLKRNVRVGCSPTSRRTSTCRSTETRPTTGRRRRR